MTPTQNLNPLEKSSMNVNLATIVVSSMFLHRIGEQCCFLGDLKMTELHEFIVLDSG